MSLVWEQPQKSRPEPIKIMAKVINSRGRVIDTPDDNAKKLIAKGTHVAAPEGASGYLKEYDQSLKVEPVVLSAEPVEPVAKPKPKTKERK